MSASTFFARSLRKLRRAANTREPVSIQVTRAYEIVLGRKPDGDGLKSYSDNIASGKQTMFDVVLDMYRSEERRTRQASAVIELYRVILRREPDACEVAFHASRLNNSEIGLTALVGEFLASNEFAVKFSMQALAPSSDGALEPYRDDPAGLASLARDLIAVHMTHEGSVVGLPPMAAAGAVPVSAYRLEALIRTLAMLASGHT